MAIVYIVYDMEGSIEDILKEAGLLDDGLETEEDTNVVGLEKDKLNLIKTDLPKKLGRPKVFETAEELYEVYTLYLADIEANPIHVKEFVGKDAKPVYKTHYRPPSWKGFEAFLFRKGIIASLDKYRRNVDEAYGDFRGIIRAIGCHMFDTKYTGGALNLWNHNIIAKEMHLAEPIEIKSFERPILENGKELPED